MIKGMSNAEMTSQELADTGDSPLTPSWLESIDRFCDAMGDRLNPILVKETRQALKSRHFVVTFGVLLVAALSWSVIGSLSMMPEIYSTPSAPKMLVGYYLVLAIPMLLVVPVAAYRSLENEIGDGTLELLSITVLSPWQIVLGKLASALLQMLLYFVALLPCVAYAYTLRGVDLPTIGLMVGSLAVAGLLVTVFGLFMAAASRSGAGRIGGLLAMVLLLLIPEFILGGFVIGIVLGEIVLDVKMLVLAIVCAGTIVPALAHLMLASAAAKLTPESENRSTPIRVSLLVLTALTIAVVIFAERLLGIDGVSFAFALWIPLLAIWGLAGSMMCAESGVMTPRIRRELPSSFMARMLLTWFTPGPMTGLVFSSVVIALTAVAMLIWTHWIDSSSSGYLRFFGSRNHDMQRVYLGCCAYLVLFLILGYCLVRLLRRRNNPQVEIGIAALAAIALLMALVPYSIGMQLNDYRPFAYGFHQITNWAWTIGEVADRPSKMYLISFIAAVDTLFLLFLVAKNRHLVMARRTATPQRVLEELENERGD